MKAKRKSIPSFPNDVTAEKFVAESDLSAYDLSGFKPMRFEVQPKAAALNMRLPASLLEAIKRKAKMKGIPYTRYVRLLLEADLSGS
jgi:predicted DNA binding CopG/RHH family protein